MNIGRFSWIFAYEMSKKRHTSIAACSTSRRYLALGNAAGLFDEVAFGLPLNEELSSSHRWFNSL